MNISWGMIQYSHLGCVTTFGKVTVVVKGMEYCDKKGLTHLPISVPEVSPAFRVPHSSDTCKKLEKY